MSATPTTSYETLKLLEKYHGERRDTYAGLAPRATDERTRLLLDYLVRLENEALEVIRGEMERTSPEHAARLMPGPKLTIDATHATECQCAGDPTFDEALACALTSDAALDEVIDHLAAGSAARSIQDLATRLRELERTKDRQIAKFTRED